MRSRWILVVGFVVYLTLGCGDHRVENADSANSDSSAVVVSDPDIYQVEAGNPAATTPTSNPSTILCKDSSGDERRLCDFLLPADSVEDQVVLDTFEVTTARVDLNRDHSDELIVWESSWAGTSGGMLWVLSVQGAKYTKLLETEMTWTPILVLASRHNGWRDISYHVTGGGVKPVFVIVKSDGKAYAKRVRIDEQQPKGDVLIEQRWQQTVFGPAQLE